MAAQEGQFTPNEEIDAYTAGDTTVEIHGFVDAILGSKIVGGTDKKVLYKFIIKNNQGRRIRVLMWEQTASKYEKLIRIGEIVYLKRAKAMPIDQRYAVAGDKIEPMELSVQRITTVELLGLFAAASTQNVKTYRKVKIENILDAEGLIVVEGYIKVEICAAIMGNCSYGTGAITDGTYKLRIQVTQFCEDITLSDGVHVQIKGEVKKDKYGSYYLQAQDMRHITIIDDEILGPDELKRGFHNPSSKRTLDLGDDNNKENITEKKSRPDPTIA